MISHVMAPLPVRLCHGTLVAKQHFQYGERGNGIQGLIKRQCILNEEYCELVNRVTVSFSVSVAVKAADRNS